MSKPTRTPGIHQAVSALPVTPRWHGDELHGAWLQNCFKDWLMFLNWLLKWKTYKNSKHYIEHPKEGQFAYFFFCFFHLLCFMCSTSLFFHRLNEVPCDQPSFVYFKMSNELMKIQSVMELSFDTVCDTLGPGYACFVTK